MTGSMTMVLPDGRNAVKVLDHGYLSLVESWGSDERIIEAARMSTGKGFQGWGEGHCLECEKAGRLNPNDKLFLDYEKQKEAMGVYGPGTYGVGSNVENACPHCKGSGKAVGDEKLLAYLWNNKHATPFEMAGMVIEVQAPIMVFREWRTHRTAAQVADEYDWDDCFPGDCSYNEMSGRYVPLPDLNYIPTVERLMLNSKTNKQAGTVAGAEELTEINADAYLVRLIGEYDRQQKLYEHALSIGVPKELARVHLPVGRYSRMRASANLRNWLAFLTLRMDEKAQYEIRVYANEVGRLIEQTFPRTWALFIGNR